MYYLTASRTAAFKSANRWNDFEIVLYSSRAMSWVERRRDDGISILHATDTRYINYNLISRHVSVLATTSSPSGSILARTNNPIKIEKLNCDDPIRATKRAPFLIRPRAADDIAKIFRVYARCVRQCTSFRKRKRELANVYSTRHTWVWQRGCNNTQPFVVRCTPSSA